MKKTLLLILAAVLALTEPVLAASEVVVLQSSRLLPYEQARRGLERVLTERPLSRGVKSINPRDLANFVLSEETDSRRLGQKIESEKPRLLVAIGSNALVFARNFNDIPIVYLLAPGSEPLTGGHPAVTGVSMAMPAGRQLQELMQSLPAVQRLGVIYDPQTSGGVIAEARKAAARLGLELVAEPARSAREVPAMLEKMRGRINGYWLLPDLTVLTPRILEEILLFSIRNNIPVMSFSERYLEAGAALAVTYDAAAMGETAGELSREILQGANAGKLPPVLPEHVNITVNHKVLEKMGISIRPTVSAVSGSAE